MKKRIITIIYFVLFVLTVLSQFSYRFEPDGPFQILKFCHRVDRLDVVLKYFPDDKCD